ncbi:MAG: type II toxin-antitoxin system RelE family toxin [Terriglobales bacterium]
MTYRVEIRAAARKYIKKLPRPQQIRILDALASLGNDPYPPASKRLTNGEAERRLRVGDWRALYDVYDDVLIVDVIRFDSRGQAYK